MATSATASQSTGLGSLPIWVERLFARGGKQSGQPEKGHGKADPGNLQMKFHRRVPRIHLQGPEHLHPENLAAHGRNIAAMRGDGELEFLLQSDIGRILAVPDLSPARRSTDVDKGDPQAVAFPMAAQGFLRNPMLLRELGDFRFNFLHQKRRSMAAHCLALASGGVKTVQKRRFENRTTAGAGVRA